MQCPMCESYNTSDMYDRTPTKNAPENETEADKDKWYRCDDCGFQFQATV